MPNGKESLRQKEPLSFAMVASKARFRGIGLIAARGITTLFLWVFSVVSARADKTLVLATEHA
jgi:hypothetical protein